MSTKDTNLDMQNDSDSDLNALICNDKCNTLLQIFESKFVNIVRAFTQLSKEFHSEQNNMKITLNSAIDTINLLVDEVETQKQRIADQQKELENAKNEINQIKYGTSLPDSHSKSHHVQQRGFPLLANSSESFSPMLINDIVQENANDIKQLREDVIKLKKDAKDTHGTSTDFQYLQNQIQKLENSSSVIQTQQNSTNKAVDRLESDFKLTFTDLKQQIAELNQHNESKSKRKGFKIGKKKDEETYPFPLIENPTVESRYLESSTDSEDQTVMDKLDSYSRDIKNMQNEIQSLKLNMENPPTNSTHVVNEIPSEYDPGEIARIQKKIVKLKERIVKLEKMQKNSTGQTEDETS